MAENVVEDYGWSTSEGPPSCNYITPNILSILRRLNVTRVLDLGAGNGTLCKELLASGFETVGMEYDKRGVEVARLKCPDVPFYHYGVQDDPDQLLAQERVFDAVVSTEVIEHLFSPHLLPQFARHVIKPGGYLILTTPYHGYLKNLVLSLFNKWDTHHTPLWHGGHIKFWSRTTLSELLTKAGFTVVSFSGVGRVPYLWKSMVLAARRDT